MRIPPQLTFLFQQVNGKNFSCPAAEKSHLTVPCGYPKEYLSSWISVAPLSQAVFAST
jgi:hypothetical protein